MAQRINILRPDREPAQILTQQTPRHEGEALSPKRLLVALFRARRFLILLFLIGAGLGVFMGIRQPNLYRSESKFLVKGSGGESLNLDPLSSSENPFQKFQVRANAPEILVSLTVLRAVAEELGPEVILAPYQPVYVSETSILRKFKNWILRLQAYLHSDEQTAFTIDAATIRLRNSLQVRASGHNDLVSVTYTANDPKRAQRILQTYMSVARTEHLKTYSNADNLELIKSNLDDATNKLSIAQSRMEGFLSGIGARDFDSEFEELKERHRTADSELRRLERQIKSDENRLRELLALQKVTKSESTQEIAVIEEDPGIAILEDSISARLQEIDQLRLKYRASDPQIRALEKLVKRSRIKLEGLKKLPPKKHIDYKVLPNPEYQANRENISRMESDLRLNRTDVVAARSLEATLKGNLKSMREHLPRYKKLKAALARAQTEFDRASRLSDLVAKKERLDSKSLSSLAVVSKASLPLEKVGPRRGRILLLSILGFLGAGFLIVVLMALSDKTVRSPEDLEAALGIQTLAIIPLIDSKNVRRHKQLRASSWN